MLLMRPYSEDLRRKIVAAVERGMPKTEATRTFGVSLSSVKRYSRLAFITAKASEYRDKQVPTTTVVVPNVPVEERESVLELLQGLSYLLSFATCSNVALYRWHQPGSKPSGERWRVVARLAYAQPVFDIRSGKTIRLYLERVWREYFRLEQARQLRVAIDLLCLPRTRA
jgi:transposase-like protein